MSEDDDNNNNGGSGDTDGDGVDAKPATRDRIPAASERELEIIRECLFEAFWYRSVPLASSTAASVFYLIKKGEKSHALC